MTHLLWQFWKDGGQLAICLVLAGLSAAKRQGSLLNWLTAGFFGGVVPAIGLLAMVAAYVWWPNPDTPPDARRHRRRASLR
jgi:hypothetical protein